MVIREEEGQGDMVVVLGNSGSGEEEERDKEELGPVEK